MTSRPVSDDPVPLSSEAPGCPALVRKIVGQWRGCWGRPEFAGWLGRPGQRRRVFACHEHKHLVNDPRPMTDVDRAELDGRIVQHMRAMAGERYVRPGFIDDEIPERLWR